ncbi:MAG: hypothetical protein KGR26_01890 [Cyanobacteria bacterium REEB65]|nr:hypothetical protein [Cyanobacteria bacterium REEB65]
MVAGVAVLALPIKQALADQATDLFDAIRAGRDVSVVDAFLDAGVGIEARDPLTGETPLIAAAGHGDGVIVRNLIARKADVNAVAVGVPSTEALQRVLDRNPDADLENRIFNGALGDAADDWPFGRDREAAISTLTNLQDLYDGHLFGQTALIAGVAAGSEAVVSDLLKAGADPNKGHAVTGTTPLMVAAGNGDLAIMVALGNAGAGVNATNSIGLCALDFAVEGVTYRPDMHDQANTTSSARAKRTRESDHCRTAVGMLIDHGADLNSGPAFGKAIQSGDIGLVRTLLVFGADPKREFVDGTTAITTAARHNHREIIALLKCATAKRPNLSGAWAVSRPGHPRFVLKLRDSGGGPATYWNQANGIAVSGGKEYPVSGRFAGNLVNLVVTLPQPIGLVGYQGEYRPDEKDIIGIVNGDKSNAFRATRTK